MAWNITIDEKTLGVPTQTIPSGHPQADASNVINNNHTLANYSLAYGTLVDDYLTPDIDVYSLGELDQGLYIVDVDDITWDYNNIDIGSVSKFAVLNSFGMPIETSYSTLTNITFTVNSPSTYYLEITGPYISEAQYSAYYNKILSNNYATIGSSPVIVQSIVDGMYTVGETVSAELQIIDADDYNPANLSTSWYVKKNGIETLLGYGNEIIIPDIAEGGNIGFNISFYDLNGFYENLGPYYSSETVQPEITTNAQGNNPVITQSLIDGKYSVGETVTGELSITDPDGYNLSDVTTTWFLNKNNIETTLGTGDQLIIPSSAEGGTIGFSKSFVDSQGNQETLGPYFTSTPVTSEIQVTKTNIILSDYSSDYDVQVLLESSPNQYKWGGELGTASNLTYSFSNYETFVLDTSYTSSIQAHTTLFESSLSAETLFSDPDYRFKNFTETSKTIVRDALDKWSEGTGIQFIEIDETNGNYGEIRFFVQDFSAWSNIDNSLYGTAAGFSYLPNMNSDFDALQGDVFLDEEYLDDPNFLSHLVMHELGHSIGLAHPHDGHLGITGVDPTVYNDANDIKEYQTVMSYDQSYKFSDGLMPLDIKAAEFLYGGNPNVNLGPNVYLFDQNDLTYRDSIIDKGGEDTLNFSALNQSTYINLSPNTWSSLQFTGDETRFLSEENWVYEVGDLYISDHTQIENVIGSDFGDMILDNSLVNRVDARNGNDIIYHFGNSDIIDGGLGIDTLNLKNKSFSDIISISQTNQNYSINFNDYQLTISEIENVIDRNAQAKSFSSLLDDYSNQAPEFTNIFSYPSNIYFPFQENRPASSPIGSVSAEDADGDSLTFQLTGRDSNFFEIVTLYTDSLGYYGQIKIKEYGLPDFDTLKDSYEIKTDIPNNPGEYVILEIEVIVSDGVSSSSKTFNPAVYNDVWDDPIIDDYDVSTPIDINSDPNEIFENSLNTIVNLTAFAEDLDAERNTVTYYLSDDAGGRFSIDSLSGVVKVKNGSLIDYENLQTHLIRVEARSLDGSSAYQDFNINVLNDVYDDNNYQVSKPTDIDTVPNQILENSLSGTTVGITVFSEDNDLSNNIVTYSILNNTDNIFSINQDGIVTLSGTIDYEVSQSYNITVQAESTDGSYKTSDFQIDILNDTRDDLPQNYSQAVRVDIGKKLTSLDITDSSIQVFNSSNNHIYEYANPNVTILDAKQITDNYLLGSKYSGHILTIDNEQERAFFSGSGEFKSLINDYVGKSWLGINLENDEWVYSSLNSDLTSTVDYFNWGPDQPRTDHSGYLWAINGGNTWTSGYNLGYTQHLILEFDGYDNNVVSDFYVGETISSKLIDASSTSNINYQWQKSQDNNIWSDIQNENSDELIISSDLVGQDLRLSISYDLNGQNYTSFSEASATISFPGEIPHVIGENSTIIQLGASEVQGIDAGIYHLYSSKWSKDHNNLSIHETPNFDDQFRLQSVTLDLSTTSDLTDYVPLDISPILLSYDQKLALMEANGFNNQDNLVVSYAHMNLNAVNYEGSINQAPSITTPDISYIDENVAVGSVVHNVQANDPEEVSVIYSLKVGGDSNIFNIDASSGEVTILSSPDFETKSSYTFEVIASDGELFDIQPVTVYVNDVFENILSPVIISNNSSTVDENVAIGSVVHNVQANDPEGVSVSYSLKVGGDSNIFNIDAGSGEVTILSSPDFETKSSYTFEVIASDGELSSSQSVTLNVLDEFDGRIFDQTDNYYEINVNQTSTVYGLYDGNNGYDQINFFVDNGETNGARVDFRAGIQGELNSAFVSSYGVDAGSVGFEINDFEKLSLTDETDYMIITDAVGINLTDQFNTDYFTTSQSVLTIDPGEAGTGTDRLDIDKDSQIHLSYESLNSTIGINVSVSETTATVTGVDVNTFVDGLSGTGQVIDRLTTTNLGDSVTNNSSLGMVVDLGNAINGETDGFIGSVDVDAIDVLDARDAYNLNFTALTNSYDVRVTGTNQSNEQKVKADLKQIDMIMVRDVAAYGITDVDFYVDLSDIYGTQQIQGLGAGSSDTYGEGYDVQTSAKVSVFGDETNKRVYYDGKHTDFVDTGEIIDTTLQGQWSMVDGAVSNGANWEQQVAASNPSGGEGSFFIVVGGKKIAVTHVDGEWIADNKALSIAQGVTRGNSGTDTITTNFGTMSEQQFIASLVDRYGLPELTDPNNYSFTDEIYLNATEQQINEVLDGDGTLTSEMAFNFGFYTKVNIGDALINLKITQTDANPGKFSLNLDNVDLIVESFYNRVETVGEGVSAGGKAANFVKVDNAQDIAMGNGGNDTYVIGSNDAGKVAGGIALEYGDLSSTGGLINSQSDSVNFADIDSITELDFVRGRDRNERADSSLFISEDGGGDATILFDNFNPYLDFRRIEYLTIDDASNNNEIYEISVDGNGGTDDSGKDLAWDNEIVVANNQGDTIYADGGIDVLVGGQGADTFDLSNVLDGSTVYIENFTANDNAILKEGSSTASNTNTSDGVIYVSANSGAESYYIYTDAEDEQLILDNMTLAGT